MSIWLQTFIWFTPRNVCSTYAVLDMQQNLSLPHSIYHSVWQNTVSILFQDFFSVLFLKLISSTCVKYSIAIQWWMPRGQLIVAGKSIFRWLPTKTRQKCNIQWQCNKVNNNSNSPYWSLIWLNLESFQL